MVLQEPQNIQRSQDMTNNNNTESTRVETLIPQQLISDSAALIDFLKEYYNFLNQSDQPTNVISSIVKNKDLDFAVDQYISIIEKEIGFGMVSKMEANKNNVYKHIEQFYDTKGSLDSFKLLFRLLYNVEIEVSLPKEQILIASDGRWKQENALFVRTISGDVFSLVNTQIYVLNTDGTRVLVEVERVRFFKEDIYEIIIDQNFIGTIKNSATITTDNYSGAIVNSIGNFTITQPGKNFQVGQVLEINDGINDDTKSLVKVTNVDSNGGIINFEFIRFGIDYQSDFSTFLIPVNYDLDFESNPGDYGYPDADKLGRVFENLHSHDYVAIEINPYSIGYFGENYIQGSTFSGDYDAVYNSNGAIIDDDIDQEIIDNGSNLEEVSASRAIVDFKLTPISKYSGIFTDNKGFLSDDIYLQDNSYYQAFSYVIKSDRRLADYENIVRKTVHPAGMAMFSQFEITNEIDASSAIELLSRLYSERLLDSVDTSDIPVKLVIKPVDDTIITSEFWKYDYNKPLEENVELVQLIQKKLEKYLVDSFSVSDILSDIKVNKGIFDTTITLQEVDIVLNRRLFDTIGALDAGIAELPNVYANDYFAQNYSEGLIEVGAAKSYFKVLSDNIILHDEILTIDYSGGEFFSEAAILSELESADLSKVLDEDVILNDSSIDVNTDKPLENSINITEFGTLDINDYSLNYFSEPYVEKIYNF